MSTRQSRNQINAYDVFKERWNNRIRVGRNRNAELAPFSTFEIKSKTHLVIPVSNMQEVGFEQHQAIRDMYEGARLKELEDMENGGLAHFVYVPYVVDEEEEEKPTKKKFYKPSGVEYPSAQDLTIRVMGLMGAVMIAMVTTEARQWWFVAGMFF